MFTVARLSNVPCWVYQSRSILSQDAAHRVGQIRDIILAMKDLVCAAIQGSGAALEVHCKMPVWQARACAHDITLN